MNLLTKEQAENLIEKNQCLIGKWYKSQIDGSFVSLQEIDKEQSENLYIVNAVYLPNDGMYCHVDDIFSFAKNYKITLYQ